MEYTSPYSQSSLEINGVGVEVRQYHAEEFFIPLIFTKKIHLRKIRESVFRVDVCGKDGRLLARPERTFEKTLIVSKYDADLTNLAENRVYRPDRRLIKLL